jgi:predicted 3-demethylubiquinone-9 3-methyltransferase (glyoxalase superfamily)
MDSGRSQDQFGDFSQCRQTARFSRLGIQAESNEELEELYTRLADASYATLDQRGANCCYAVSDKHWAVDPVGTSWEMFHTMGEVAIYGKDITQDLDKVLLA